MFTAEYGVFPIKKVKTKGQKKLKVAIIGCGGVAHGHIRAWKANAKAEVAMLVDLAMSQVRKIMDDLELDEKISTSRNYENALKSEEIDIVDICTPSHLHTTQIIDALTAKKHIVVEKPTGYNLEECRKLKFYLHKYPESKVAVAYSLRYYPLNLEVKKLMEEGRIGQPIYGQFTWNHSHRLGRSRRRSRRHKRRFADRGGFYKPGSEASHTTHIFDLSRYMLGEVEEVFAYKSRKIYGTYALAIFENGAAALLTSSIASRLGLRNPTVVSIQGTKGTIQTGMSKKREYTGELIAEDRVSPIKASKETGHGDRVRTQNIINAILKDEPLIAPLEDGIKTSEFLHAIWDSYTLGIRVPMHVSEPTG